MNRTGIMFGLVLVLAVPAVGTFAADFSLCPAIAESAQVRKKGIDYLRAREFADAVRSVANGTSGFAPMNVPAEWKSAANLWGANSTSTEMPRISVVTSETGSAGHRIALLSPSGMPIEPTRIGLDDRSCNSDLLFRASLEYRSRKGDEDVPLLYPHLVRKAVSGIGKMILARMDSAERGAKRVDDISARILHAENTGVGMCQPKELAHAKADLAVAIGAITQLDNDPGGTETVLLRAESSSANLLAAGRYASIHRLQCGP